VKNRLCLLALCCSFSSWAQGPAVLSIGKLQAGALSLSDRQSAYNAAKSLAATAPAPEVTSASRVENLFGNPGWAKPKFAPSGSQSLLVVGEQVDLTDVDVRSTSAPLDIVVIARRIRVDRDASFTLEGQKKGGSLKLVALEGFEGAGKFKIRARGRDASDDSQSCNVPSNAPPNSSFTIDHPPDNGGDGGKVHIYAGSGAGPLLDTAVTGGAAGKGCRLIYSSIQTVIQHCVPGPAGHISGGGFFGAIALPGKPICTPQVTSSVSANLDTQRVGSPGSDGTVTLVTSLDDLSAELPPEMFWTWTSGQFVRIEADALDAVRTNNNDAVVAAFRRYYAMPKLPLPVSRLDAYTTRVQRLNKLREDVLPPIWFQDITVAAEGMPPSSAILLTEAASLKRYLAPSAAVVRQITAEQGVPKWGAVVISPANPQLASVYLSSLLSVDPRLAAAVASQQQLPFKEVGQPFTGWTLTGRPEPVFGLDATNSKVSVSGTSMDLQLVVDSTATDLLLWKLARAPGLRIDISWTYQDQNGRNATGPSFPIYVRLDRREELPITVSAGNSQVTNTSGTSARGYYLITDEGQIASLNPPLLLGPAEHKDLPSQFAPWKPLGAPVQAIEYVASPSTSPYEALSIKAAASILQDVVVSNLLPAYSDTLKDSLMYVEVVAETSDRDSPSSRVSLGPYRLGPAGAQGSEINLKVLRLPGRTMLTRISGSAIYQGGSKRTMKPVESSDMIIKLESKLFE